MNNKFTNTAHIEMNFLITQIMDPTLLTLRKNCVLYKYSMPMTYADAYAMNEHYAYNSYILML